MKKTISGLVFLFAFAASLVAKGEAKNGNCKDAAVKITPSDSVQTAVLQREWDPYGGINGTGDWSDGGHQELAIGVKWYYAKLTKGKNYVLWMDDVGVAYDDLLSMSIEPPDYDSGQVADSLFAEYIDSAGSTFMYLTAETGYDYGQWSPNDPDECTFYICFSDNDVGKSAEFYLTEESIVNHVPAGALLNPIELNVSESGSVRVVKVPDEYSTHYRFSAEAGNHYVFTCSSYPTNMPSIQLSSVSGDQEAVNEEFRSWADGTTGTYVYDFSITNGTMTAVITVEADDPSLCDLSWVCTKVGIAGRACRFKCVSYVWRCGDAVSLDDGCRDCRAWRGLHPRVGRTGVRCRRRTVGCDKHPANPRRGSVVGREGFCRKAQGDT